MQIIWALDTAFSVQTLCLRYLRVFQEAICRREDSAFFGDCPRHVREKWGAELKAAVVVYVLGRIRKLRLKAFHDEVPERGRHVTPRKSTGTNSTDKVDL